MSKWEVKNAIDYSPNGDDIDALAQKVIAEEEAIYALLQRLRTLDASAGTDTSDNEAYQFKINTTTNDILIRSADNTGWHTLGKLDDNFGLTPKTIGAMKNIGGAYGIGVGNIADRPAIIDSITGSFYYALDKETLYYFYNGVWISLLSLDIETLSGYDSLIKESDVSANNAPKKILMTNEDGIIDCDITGSANKIKGIAVDSSNATDGKVLTYNEAKGSLVFETVSGTVAGAAMINARESKKSYVVNETVYSTRLTSGKYLKCIIPGTTGEYQPDYSIENNGMIIDGSVYWKICSMEKDIQFTSDTPLNQADGDILIQKTSNSTDNGKNAVLKIKDGNEYIPVYLTPDSRGLAESTGAGIISGFDATVSGRTVNVQIGTAHMITGYRAVADAASIAINAADTTNPRADLIYLSSAGAISYLAGTAAASPIVPSVPSGGLALQKASVGIDGTVTLTDLRGFKARYNLLNIFNIKEFGAVGDGVTDDTEKIQLCHDYIVKSGKRGTIWVPSATYKITQLKINTLYVSILSDGAILDASGLSSGLYAITFYGYGGINTKLHGSHVTHYKGFHVIGNRNCHAIRFHTNYADYDNADWSNAGTAHINFDNCAFSLFNQGVTFGDHAYLISFNTCEVFDCQKNIYYPDGLTDSGENIQFNFCSIYAIGYYQDYKSVAFYLMGEDTCEINCYGCSIDYVDQFFIGTGALKLVNCHLETSRISLYRESQYLIVLQSGEFASFTMIGGTLIVGADILTKTITLISNDTSYGGAYFQGVRMHISQLIGTSPYMSIGDGNTRVIDCIPDTSRFSSPWICVSQNNNNNLAVLGKLLSLYTATTGISLTNNSNGDIVAAKTGTTWDSFHVPIKLNGHRRFKGRILVNSTVAIRLSVVIEMGTYDLNKNFSYIASSKVYSLDLKPGTDTYLIFQPDIAVPDTVDYINVVFQPGTTIGVTTIKEVLMMGY